MSIIWKPDFVDELLRHEQASLHFFLFFLRNSNPGFLIKRSRFYCFNPGFIVLIPGFARFHGNVHISIFHDTVFL